MKKLKCCRCCKEKKESSFGNDIRHISGKKSICKNCEKEDNKKRYKNDNGEKQSWNNRMYRYGISQEDFNKMFEKQFGLCSICLEKLPDKRKIHIDHNHYTREIRGLLCARCNIIVAVFENNKELIGNVVDYLE